MEAFETFSAVIVVVAISLTEVILIFVVFIVKCFEDPREHLTIKTTKMSMIVVVVVVVIIIVVVFLDAVIYILSAISIATGDTLVPITARERGEQAGEYRFGMEARGICSQITKYTIMHAKHEAKLTVGSI